MFTAAAGSTTMLAIAAKANSFNIVIRGRCNVIRPADNLGSNVDYASNLSFSAGNWLWHFYIEEYPPFHLHPSLAGTQSRLLSCRISTLGVVTPVPGTVPRTSQ